MEKSVFHCEHPIRVRNKYDGRIYYVPCRKCAACRIKKATEWTNRLNIEAKSHPYSFFGTLTYAPEFLPYLDVDFSKKVLFSSTDSGVIYDFKDLSIDNLSYEFIKRRKCLPIGKIEDVRSFIKRVRERIRSNKSGEAKECRYLRYFLVCEYGSTCLRPHYHFLFFTASKWFAEHSKSVVSSCWCTDNRSSNSKSLGRIDCQSVKNSASSYVASYLNCFDNLPKVYTFRKFRPFSVSSKQPPIGTLFESSKEIQEIFNSGSCTRSVRNGETNEVLEIPFPATFSNRLYPKIKGFDRIPLDVLNRLYGESVEASIRSFNEFKGYVEGKSKELNDVSRYYKEFILSHDRLDSLNPEKVVDPESALHNLFSIFNRFHIQRLNFGVSVGDYVSRIYQYWKDRDMFMLKTQQEFQERISKVDPTYTLLVDFDLLSDLRFWYDDFLRLNDLNGFIKLMQSYGIYFYENSFSGEIFKVMSYKDDRVTSRYFDKANVVVSESKKHHEKNDYFLKADLDNDLRNFLIYFNSIKHGYKECY